MKYLSETAILIVLAILVSTCLIPLFGSGMAGMVLHSLLVIAFGFFATFFWRERPSDEREVFHQMFAGRVAFFVGVALLLVWMMWQVYIMQSIDPILIIVIVVMLLAKVIAHIYSRRHC